MATKTRLTYSNSRGFGEKIRLMLCLLEIPFENVVMKKRSEFLKLCADGVLLFNQTPFLEYNGLKLVQSHATMRYLAGKHDMYGANLEERVRIDMFYDAIQDFVIHFVNFQFFVSAEQSLKDGKVAADKYCPILEKELAVNKTGFLLGSTMSLADVAMIDVLLEVEEHYGDEYMKLYPNLKDFLSKIKEDKRIQDYLKNVRFPSFTPEMVQEVKELFAIP